MTMFPFAFPFQLAVAMNAIPGGLDVIDARYETRGHTDVLVKTANRNIRDAAIDRSGGKRLEAIFGGSVADGDMMLLTSAKLYVSSEYDPSNQDPNDERRYQTFFTYGNHHYRVAGVDPWDGQLGISAYLAKLHVPQQIMEGAAQGEAGGDQ